jgi:HSP20 family molecular chaperone IbpA
MFRKSHPADWMFAEALELVDRAERIHRQFFRLARSTASWEPPADVFESAEGVAIVVALPGVVAADVEVLAHGGEIVVRAFRPQPLHDGCHAVRQLEIPYGRFERRVQLPAGEFAPASQELTHGCLILRLRRIA